MILNYTRQEVERALDIIRLPVNPGESKNTILKGLGIEREKLLDDWLALDAAEEDR